MRRDHFFDWHGFKFAAKVLVLLFIAGTLGRYTLLYAAQSRLAGPSSLVLIQETRPAPPKSLSLSLSTTTSRHIIRTLTVNDAVPPAGKFIAVDLSSMVLTLYQEGVATAKYPILAKGKPGSPYETPAGFYSVLVKEPDRPSGGEEINLPWSVRFYGNYFIHGWPYYRDNGSPVNAAYAGGDIRLRTEDAEKVYDFAEEGVGIFVYEPPRAARAALVLDAIPVPLVSATSYVVADIETGDVFLEQNAGDAVPITSATTLMTVLVENEMFPIDAKNNVAQIHDTPSFVGWMNASAKTLGMQSTHFADAVGTSTENVSTPDDLVRLAAYLAREKSFILDIIRTPARELIADSGSVYRVENTAAPKGAAVSVVSVPINGVERRAAVIVIASDDSAADTKALTDWFTQSAVQGAGLANTACITCVILPPYRKIQL